MFWSPSACKSLLHIFSWLLLLSSTASVAQAVPLAQLDPVNLSDVRRGSLMLRPATESDASVWRLAPTLNTQATISVTGPIARTVLRQRFHNSGDDWAEATYAFPLPQDAAVDQLRMYVGERIIVGEIQEKQQARQTFQRAREAGQRSALVEQARANLFTSQVANIPPHSEIRIELEYQQELVWREGAFSLRFPMAITPRYQPGQVASESSALPSGRSQVQGWALLPGELPHQAELDPAAPGHNPTEIEVLLQPGFEMAPPISPYHPIHTQRLPDHTRVELAAGSVPSERDFVLQWMPQRHEQVQAAWFVESGERGDYALLMLMPPQAMLQAGHARARELIFIIDTSGSMGGEPIRAARQGLLAGLDHLSPGDRFNIIEFNSQAHALFPQPVDVTAEHLQQARRRTRKLRADGGTEMRQALELALPQDLTEPQERLRQIVFITDGAVGNEAELMQLIHQRLGNARLFTVGIGSAPNAHFMTEAAHFGRGSFRYIAHSDEVETAMRGLFAQLDHPALTDIELDLPVASDALPQPIPDLYRGEPISVVMRLNAAASQAQLRGQVGLRPWQHELELQQGLSQHGIATLWARRKITDWTRQGRRGLDAETVRRQVLDLALKHHLVSEFTSLVAVDKSQARNPGDPLSAHPLKSNLPAGLQVPLARGATPSWALQLAGLCLLLLAGLLQRKPAARCHA